MAKRIKTRETQQVESFLKWFKSTHILEWEGGMLTQGQAHDGMGMLPVRKLELSTLQMLERRLSSRNKPSAINAKLLIEKIIVNGYHD
mgnify:CR=1 FL=1